MTGFKPLETTMDTFIDTEQKLFEQFTRFGYAHEVAKAIAHSFTQYMLGYLTEEGVAKKIVDSGADTELALTIVRSFREIKQRTDHPTLRKPGKAQSETAACVL